LYLFEKPKSTVKKNHNHETKILAEKIKTEIQNDINHNKYGFGAQRKELMKVIDLPTSEYLSNSPRPLKSSEWCWL